MLLLQLTTGPSLARLRQQRSAEDHCTDRVPKLHSQATDERSSECNELQTAAQEPECSRKQTCELQLAIMNYPAEAGAVFM